MKLSFLNSEQKERKINCKVHGAKLFSEVHRDTSRGNWHTLKHRKYPVNIKRLFFFIIFFLIIVRVTEHWDRLKILEKFKSCLDMVHGKLLEVTVPEQEVEQDNLQ